MTGFSYGNIDVSSTVGPFRITADNPSQLLLEGYDAFDTYFTYGGAAFALGASPPPPPPVAPALSSWMLMIGGFAIAGEIARPRRGRQSVTLA
jgi:hypothetical protein